MGEGEQMLLAFEHYLTSLDDLTVEVSKQGSNSIVAEVADERFLARFTVWEQGSFVAEVMDLEGERFVLETRVEFDDTSQLKSGFDAFLNAMGRR